MKEVNSCGDLKEPAKVAIALAKERGSPHFHYDFGDPSGHEFGDPQRIKLDIHKDTGRVCGCHKFS